jgi:hypothetical protein
MAATLTVTQRFQQRNFTPIKPKHGVITLRGYGIKAHVDRGHLILEDGIGPERRLGRFPRVRHGLRRLVVIGADGMVSLAALRWLADQDAAFVMLDRNGKVLATTGPVAPSDVRLRCVFCCGLGHGQLAGCGYVTTSLSSEMRCECQA